MNVAFFCTLFHFALCSSRERALCCTAECSGCPSWEHYITHRTRPLGKASSLLPGDTFLVFLCLCEVFVFGFGGSVTSLSTVVHIKSCHTRRSLFLGRFWTTIQSDNCFETVTTPGLLLEGWHCSRELLWTFKLFLEQMWLETRLEKIIYC